MKPVVKKENQWFDVGIVKVTNMVVTHFYVPADDSLGDVSVSDGLLWCFVSEVALCILNNSCFFSCCCFAGRFWRHARLQPDEENGVTARNSLQVSCCWNQCMRSWRLFRDISFQDMFTGFPWSSLCHQNQQGKLLDCLSLFQNAMLRHCPMTGFPIIYWINEIDYN